MTRLRLLLLGSVLTISCWYGHSVQAEIFDYDEYIVRHRPGTALVQSKLFSGLKNIEVTQLRSASDYYLVRAPKNQQVTVLSWLKHASNVLSYQPNYRYQALFVPNDPSYALQWNLPAVNAPGGWDIDITAPLYGGDPGVIVAVIDTGVAYENFGKYQAMPDFSGTSFVAGTDVINSDTHANDDVGHGTHVAATIAQATNNLQFGAGISFNSTIMPIKVLDDSGIGTTLDIAAGIDFAREHGADVINLSLGGASDDPFLHLAIQAAANAGIPIVAAAGNQATSGLFYPARYDEVISVAATGPANTLAPYSNYGTGLDIAAPGGDMTSNASYGILQMTCQTGAPSAVPCTTDVSPTFAEIYYEGTSQATPHVSAAAALLIAAGVPPTNVRSVLIGSAQDLGPAGYDTTYGWGLLDISKALSVGLNDTVAPTGTVSISAAASYTKSTTVDVQVLASDDQSAVVAMSFSNDGTTFSNWEDYQSSRSAWNMTAIGGNDAEGTKTVYARFRDAAGNISTAVTDTIEYDRQPPLAFTVRVHAAAPYQAVQIVSGKSTSTNKLTAEWGLPSDARSGLAGFRVLLSTKKSEALLDGSLSNLTSYTLPILTSSTTCYLHVGAVDQAGNVRVSTFTLIYRPAKIVVATEDQASLIVRTATGKLIKRYSMSPPADQRPYEISAATLKIGDPERLLKAVGGSQAIVAQRDSGASVLTFQSRYGAAVSRLRLAAGDIGGDARSEILTSPERGRAPINVFDARGRRLRSFYPFGIETTNGVETAVAQTRTSVRRIVAGQRSNGSLVRVFSTAGKPVKQWRPFTISTGDGISLATGDVNGDGQDEVIIAPAVGRPEIRIYTLTGKRLKTFRAFPLSQRSGLEVGCIDSDGDGDDEIVVLPRQGAAHVRIFDEHGQQQKSWFATSQTYRGKMSLTTLR